MILYFTVADKTGRISAGGTPIPYFLKKIKPAVKRHADFEIKIGQSANLQYELRLLSLKAARLDISSRQSLPPYGYMTIMKGLLQALLLQDDIILFHGAVDRNGYILLNGSNMNWFDRLDSPSDAYGRLVIVKGEKGKYCRYSNFLKEDFSEKPVPVTGIRFMGKLPDDAKSRKELLLRSTWYYLFFEHFGNKTKHFLPVQLTKRLNAALHDFDTWLGGQV